MNPLRLRPIPILRRRGEAARGVLRVHPTALSVTHSNLVTSHLEEIGKRSRYLLEMTVTATSLGEAEGSQKVVKLVRKLLNPIGCYLVRGNYTA